MKCPQCGAGSVGLECPQCRYTPAVCEAAPHTGHRGMDPFFWVKIGAIPLGVFLLFGVSGLAGIRPGAADPGGSGATNGPKGTLQLQFAANQSFGGMEVFLDDKVLQNPGNRFELSPGSHKVAIKLQGKPVFSQEVAVKPADQGVTVVQVPLVQPVGDAKMLLQIKCPTDGAARNLELFFDGKLTHTFQHGFELTESEWKLSPGEHAVALKKNGYEVYAGKVEVKNPSDGTTYLKIDLVVTGTVVVKSPAPIGVGVEAYVTVDGEHPKAWAVGSTAIEVTPEVGAREIKVYTKKPLDKVWMLEKVQVEPGGRVELILRL